MYLPTTCHCERAVGSEAISSRLLRRSLTLTPRNDSYIKRVIFTLVFIIGYSFFSIHSASAFTIQPLRYRVTVDPGKSATVSLKILNDESTTHRFRVFASAVGQDSEGRPIFGAFSDSAESWVSPDTKTFTLAPGEKKNITFAIQVPPNADPGSHFLALVASPEDPKNSSLGVSGRAAALLSLVVSGAIQERLSITQFVAVSPVQTVGNWPLKISLRNTGNILIGLEGSLAVKTITGKVVSDIPVIFGNSLLPRAERSISSRVKFDATKLHLPGRYNLELMVRYGAGRSVARAYSAIWYFPPWSIGVAIIVFLAIIFLVVLRKFRSNKII